MSSDVRDWLSRETADLHAEVDHAASRFDLASRTGCEGLLAFFAAGIVAVEAALDRAGAGQVWPGYPGRTRRDLLPPRAVRGEPPLQDEGAVWGALYVMEGSRFGAEVLRRQWPILGDYAFFRETSTRYWPNFLQDLSVADDRLCNRHAMAEGAAAAYRAFTPAMSTRTLRSPAVRAQRSAVVASA